jgi:hypothetical protein
VSASHLCRRSDWFASHAFPPCYPVSLDRASLERIDRLRSTDKNAIRPFHVNVPEAEITELYRGKSMANLAYHKEITALLVIDPYNDFISEGGKIWDRIKAVAEANQCVPNMLKVLDAARQAKVRIFYAMHCRYRPGDYENWKYIAPIQKAAWTRKSFE